MRLSLLLISCLLVAATPAAAQDAGGYTPASAAITGVQARGYTFENGFGTDRIAQVAFPLVAVIPLGERFTLDMGSHYATTIIRPEAGQTQTYHGFTDTQLRGSYVFGRDAVVASVVLNLPTGERPTASQAAIAGQAASSFLLLPVNSYYNGFSATAGLAVAQRLGRWNVGFASSARIGARYRPYSAGPDSITRIEYNPGVEERFRVGVDRLVGASRLTLGVTYSTFSNDEFNNFGGGTSRFAPGGRFISEASFTAPMRGGSWSLYAWDYYRKETSGPGGTTSSGKENLLTAGISARWALGGSLAFEPLAEARFWDPVAGGGQLYGLGAALRYQVGPRVVLVPSARGDYGRIEKVTGERFNLFGWGASALLRYSF